MASEDRTESLLMDWGVEDRNQDYPPGFGLNVRRMELLFTELGKAAEEHVGGIQSLVSVMLSWRY